MRIENATFIAMKEIARYSGCFVCGDQNEFGLHARFYFKDNRAFTECVASRRFEGYHDIYHGGITATLMDEVMIKALLAKNIFALTVELTVKFHKAVYINQTLRFEGWMEKRRGRLFITHGEARNEQGDLVATAAGKYLQAGSKMQEKLQESLNRRRYKSK
ncbi:MAG: PaaI family thioesterase [Candidatus Zixiibacteriota bacterium]|nr:MAG: PaaI family thioesterase [candidate division Zixibacteria bacterium]